MHFDYLELFLAVFGMGSNPFDYDYPTPVSNLYNHSVRISLYIENHFVVGQEVSRFISPLYVLWRLPCVSPDFISPCVQMPSDISVILFVLFKQGQIQYAHLRRIPVDGTNDSSQY